MRMTISTEDGEGGTIAASTERLILKSFHVDWALSNQ